MKKLTSLFLAALTCLAAVANPAHPGSVLIPQPDGTMLSVCLVGDEYYHFNTTVDGYTIMLNEAGAYVYAQSDGMSLVPTQLLAHDAENRDASEQLFLANLPKHLVDETSVAAGHVRRVKRDVDLSNFDFENFRGLVILLDFTDKKFASDDPQAFYTEMFSSENFSGYHDPITGRDVSCPGSVRDYFNDQSNGVLQPPFDVFGPYPATYVQNGVAFQARAAQCDNYSQIIFNNALKQANDDINYAQYDNNSDGKIDMVYFLVAGYSSSFPDNNRGYLWPHASNLSWTGSSYDGKKIDRYACSTELYGFESTPNTVTVEGIGTVAHEFSHVLGLPDLYDTDYDKSGGQSHDPGEWDVMAGGGDYNDGRSPLGYSFYERYSLGWATAREITEPGHYTLNPVNTAREGFILRSPVENEFFIFENRQRTGWDSYLPGHGMLVTRVDSTNVNVWNQNAVNVNPNHNYYELLRAGDSRSGAMATDPFPGTSGNIMLTNETTPNLLTWAGVPSEFIINAIAENNGVITFNAFREGTMTALVEDFETMPVSTGTTDQNVEGRFASWSFTNAGVRAPGEGKAYDENSVMMKMPSLFYSTTPIYYNIYMVSLYVFNTSSSAAKYSLEYTVDDDANGEPIWVTATSSKGDDFIEVPLKSSGYYYWTLDLTNTQPARFRIYELAGNKNAPTYIDNLTFYYTGEEGGPAQFKTGDVNGDGEVNIADVNAAIKIILGETAAADVLERADVNNDDEINIADVNAIIKLILN